MAWEHLSITKPHLAYMILGGFTSLFMLCSLFIKEKLYIGEASVATVCGLIFGPHAANLFNPLSWGNTDSITLECSRIVLVVQCFAVGVELPKSYMEKHWKSVACLLIPVMTYGWLVTSLFIWWMIEPLSWLESLACAACVTATDPVLASSVVGKGKFARRVPKHLRDVLSAESGCNDGMAFPFIYLSVYLIRYRPDASKVAFHWICYTILYECLFGAIYGFLIGYVARHAIKKAENMGIIDRESFLVFYFVLALFCAGSGSLLGMDDLLIGFSAGVGFSNDGWFSEKTEESHVSNVIDLLLNLAYFVYLGSIIPWDQYNAPDRGIVPWRLVVISIFVLFFRRIPAMLALKPIMPDVKTWREALFAGHFGPIGVGAIFACILARAELETDGTEPLAVLPPADSENYNIVYLIWPITTFLVITSIIVHGSSIAVFTLGKRINTLTITLSYTQANEEGPAWMNRLPRISSQSKQDLSFRKEESFFSDSQEKLPEYPPGAQLPLGLPGNFLRRQRDDDTPSRAGSRSSSVKAGGRKIKRWDSGMGPGGPISQSAIMPQRREETVSPQESGSDTLNEKTDRSPEARLEAEEPPRMPHQRRTEPQVEVFEEGHNLVIEDEEGNVISTVDMRGMSEEEKQQSILDARDTVEQDTTGEFAKSSSRPHGKNEGEEVRDSVRKSIEDTQSGFKSVAQILGAWSWGGKKTEQPTRTVERRRGPAHAYQFGNTIIVEDEDGEVLKKYTIPASDKRRPSEAVGRRASMGDVGQTRRGLQRMGTWIGLGGEGKEEDAAGPADVDVEAQKPKSEDDDTDDEGLRFNVNLPSGRSRRMSKTDFINQIRQFDPKARAEILVESDAPQGVEGESARWGDSGLHQPSHKPDALEETIRSRTAGSQAPISPASHQNRPRSQTGPAKTSYREDRPPKRTLEPQRKESPHGSAHSHNSRTSDVPVHDVAASLARYSQSNTEVAARRRRLGEDFDESGNRRDLEQSPATMGESAAEKRRRLAALGTSGDMEDSDSEDDGRPRVKKGAKPVPGPPGLQGDSARERGGTARDSSTSRRQEPRLGIRFLEPQSPSSNRSKISWGGETGRNKKTK